MEYFGETSLQQLMLLMKEKLNEKANSVDIPTQVSSLENDSGFITTETVGESWGGVDLEDSYEEVMYSLYEKIRSEQLTTEPDSSIIIDE